MADVDVRGGGDRDQFPRIIDPDDVRAAFDDLVRQCPVAAADIEDPLAELRVEQVERSGAQVRYESADAGIIRGVPAAGRGDGGAQSVFTQSR